MGSARIEVKARHGKVIVEAWVGERVYTDWTMTPEQAEAVGRLMLDKAQEARATF